MVIICNGAFKSGSTWLYNIVRGLGDFAWVPKEWQNERWRNSSVSPERMEAFLAEYAHSDEIYLSKNHLAQRQFVRVVTETYSDHVRLLNIRRDIRDVIVSAFFHHERKNPSGKTFDEFYAETGPEIARRVDAYHRKWNVGAANVFCTSYEELLENSIDEIGRICDFLGLEIGAERMEQVRDENSFGNWKAATGSDHLRKGVVGDWKNYLSVAEAENLRRRVEPFCFSPLAD